MNANEYYDDMGIGSNFYVSYGNNTDFNAMMWKSTVEIKLFPAGKHSVPEGAINLILIQYNVYIVNIPT